MENRFPFRLTLEAIWLAAGFALLCCVYYFWGWSRVLGDFGGDSAFYLLIAQYLSPWTAHSDVAAYFYANSLYPPLFPLALALFGGGQSLLAAHVITITFLLLAFIALHLWQRSLGISRTAATLTTLLFALLPGTYMQALSVLSENLYLLSSLGCLVSVGMFEASRRERWLWIAAVCVAAAVLTRSAGVSLLAAFLLYMILHRPRGSWRIVLIAVLPIMLWKLLGPQQAPGYLSSLASKYGDDLSSAVMRQFSLGIRMLWLGWTGNFTTGSVGIWMTAVVGVVGLLGTVWRIFHRKLDGIYAGIYICLIFIWPFPAEAKRLLFVIVPVLLVQCLVLLDNLPPFILSRRRIFPRYLVLLFLTIIATPSLLLTANRFSQSMPDQAAHFRRNEVWYVDDIEEAREDVIFYNSYTEHLKSLPVIVSGSDCIYSTKPSLVGYYAGRVSKVPPRPESDATEFDAYLRKTGCRYFYLVGFLSTSYPIIYYPLTRLEGALVAVSVSPGSPNPDRPVGILAVLKDD